jgi:hypothetical protein
MMRLSNICITSMTAVLSNIGSFLRRCSIRRCMKGFLRGSHLLYLNRLPDLCTFLQSSSGMPGSQYH